MVLFTPLDIVSLLHSVFTTLLIMTVAFLFGVLFFTVNLSDKQVSILKWISVFAAASAFLTNLFGAYASIYYRLPIPTSPRSILLKTEPAAHEIFFESMEHNGIIIIPLFVLIAYCVWHYQARVVTDADVKKALFILLALATLIILLVAFAGIVPTRLAAVR